MIPDDLRLSLIEALMRVPLVGIEGEGSGRTALLIGIPQAAYFSRNEQNARGDLMILVAQLEESFGPGGEWRLLQLIENAVPTVRGTELQGELLTIRRALEDAQSGITPRRVHPAEVAQLHLFDLRRPVLMCISMLPVQPAVSGFVVPSRTARLLRYLCESVRYRGADLRTWGRDEVAPNRPPLEVDPLHTTAALAAEKALKVRDLLARKHVIWAAHVAQEEDAAALWQGIAAGFANAPPRHLVVIFGMPDATRAPTGMTQLPAPAFTRIDVAHWVTDIARQLDWQEAIIQRWAAMIVTGYAEDDLPVDELYERLEYHRDLLTSNRTQDALGQALDELDLAGG